MTSAATATGINFNGAADLTYGSICFLCVLIGTFGNIVSFIHFKSEKRGISSVLYMFITANDIAVSIILLPVGISFVSKRQPGIIFGNKYGCESWVFMWRIAISVSIFLVLCLSITRTISLLRPFKQQKIRYMVITVATYLVLMIVRVAYQRSFSSMVSFSVYTSSCTMYFDLNTAPAADIVAILMSYNIVYTAPSLVVATSCAISAVILTRRKENVQQRELQQSRNRATVTILLFALLYGVCNVPLLVIYIIRTVSVATNNDMKLGYELFKFDELDYYYTAVSIILPAANSAANPALYFWRMPALREYYTWTGIRRKIGIFGRQQSMNVSINSRVDTSKKTSI